MADGKVVIETDLDSSGIEKGLKNLGSITAKGLKATTATIAGTATALSGVSAAAIKVGSDFEAQMSRVKAISGATGREFEALKEQAIQLGADTAFSSAQAAEGMENLAAAGFTTNEIMSAMPGLLDLAAASGEDLANSSDIAASTLRGFGLEASEAGHVADVLAENANRTNSSVAETGEAMKYVAPLARAAGISLEETAAAIGIMANAGIQGSQAGTTLRGALSRLSKPTTDMQQAMDELGVSFYDSEGKMLSLTDQVGMLKSAMEGMTDEQKNNYLVTLYGQEALSGMLALINEGSDSLASLTASYEACDGSAQTAAATMQDNLKGAIEQLSGSAESLGIVFYEDVSGSLKEAAQAATDSVNNITDAFNNGGLESAIEAAGDEFGNLAAEAASHAPEMVDAAVGFISSFADGIIKNRSKLLSAAGEVAETFAGGLAELLPKELQEPVEEAVDAISDSLSGGGLKSAGKTAVNTLENVIDVAGKLADVALPPLTKAVDLAAENLDLVAASAAAAFTAFKGYKIVTSAGKATKSLVATVKLLSAAEKANALQVLAASGALTTKEFVVGVLTGKITLATAAQTAWNAVMAANPIGLVITAVAALSAAIGAAILTSDKASDSTSRLTEKQKESIEASKEAIKSIEEEAEARQKNINASTAEIDNAEALWNELTRIVDANGQVKAGYEARAEYITGKLSSALGTEISMTDGVIDNYGELQNSIYDVIAAKKAEAALASMESDWNEAKSQEAELVATLSRDYDALNAAKDKVVQTEKKLKAAYEEAPEIYSETGQKVKQLSGEYYALEESLKTAKADLEVQQKAFKKSSLAVEENGKKISDYELLLSAAMDKNTDAINNTLSRIQSGIDTTLDAGTDAALKQAQETGDTLLSILSVQEEGLYDIQQSTIDSTAQSMGIAINTISTSSAQMKELLKSVGAEGAVKMLMAFQNADIAGSLSEEAKSGMQAMISAMEGMEGNLSQEAKNALQSFIAGFKELDSKTREVWAKAWYGALEGLEGFEDLANPAKEGVDTFLESLKEALEVHSPSRAVKDIFSQVWPGAEEGLSEGQEELNTTGNTVIRSFLTTLSSGGLFEGTKSLGSSLIGFFTNGMLSQKPNVDNTSKGISDSMNTNLGSADTLSTGAKKTGEYNSGIIGQKPVIDITSKAVSDLLNTNLGSADTQGTGSRKIQELNLGIESQKENTGRAAGGVSDTMNTQLGSADTQGTGARKIIEYNGGIGSGDTRSIGRQKAQEGQEGMGSVDAGSTGSNFIAGFINGFGWQNVWSAAYNIGMNALSAIKSALGIASPSKEAKKIGAFFGEGFSIGISSEKNAVGRTSKELANAALDALDMSDISSRMRETMSLNTGRITKSFAMQSNTKFLNSQEQDTMLSLQDKDIQRLANAMDQAVRKGMAGTTVKIDGKTVGKLVTPTVNDELGRLNGRRT